jgi:hypothetical protein
VGAILVALIATGVAAYQAGKNSTPPTAAGTGGTLGGASGQPGPVVTTGRPAPSGTGNVTPGPTAVPSDINPSAEFTPAYQLAKQLQLRPGTSSCVSLYVDLDEPRVNVDENISEFYLDACGDSESLNFETDTTVSVAPGPNTTPNECAESIQTSAMASGARIPVQQNVVLCVVTSFSVAARKGITRKIALIVIKALGADRTVTMQVSAWNIPA